MAECSNHIPGVEILHFEELQDWHRCPKAFDNYDINFILPVSLGMKYQPDDIFLESAFTGNITALQTFSKQDIHDYRDDNGNNLLTVASYCDQLDTVQWLHTNGVSLNHRSSTGVTPILAAAAKNHLRIVEWLLDNGANANDYNSDNCSPLMACAYNGHVAMVCKIQNSGGNINQQDTCGRTPLMAACQRGHTSVVRILVQQGADVNLESSGKTACFFAAVTGRTECLAVLAELNKGTLCVHDDDDWSLLAVAAFHGNVAVVEELHRSGVNGNRVDKLGRTALMAAAEAGHYSVVNYLVDSKVSVDVQSTNGITAFDLAISGSYSDVANVLVKHMCINPDDKTKSGQLIKACRTGDFEVVQYLVEGGCSINQSSELAISPIMASCMGGNIELTSYLLNMGADVHATSVNDLNAYQAAYIVKDFEMLQLLEPYFSSELATLCCNIPVAAATVGDIEVITNLHQRGEDINAVSEKGITPLMMASHHGHYQLAKLLLENNANVSIENQSGAVALTYAIDGNHHAMVDLLVGYGASVNTTTSHGTTTCHILTSSQQMDFLKRVVHFGGDINCQDRDGLTPLMIACQKGCLDLVKFFVDNNANLSKRCAQDYDAIAYAFMSDNTEISDFINNVPESNQRELDVLKQHFNVFSHRFDTCELDSPFFKACAAGELSLVQDLCAQGHNIHALNNNDVNALHYAAFHGHDDLMRWLLENGALINWPTSEGLTPLMIACHEGQEDIVQILIQHKCLINLRDHIYRSAIFFTVVNQHTSILRILLQHSAIADLVDADGSTGLNNACLRGLIDIVMILVENHADINKKDAYGRTPLMAAARNGHQDVVEFLVEKQVNIGITCGEGNTAADYARSSNYIETYHFLIDAANPNVLPVDVEVGSSSELRKLHTICATGKDVAELADLLNNEKVDINGQTSNGDTGLILAASWGHTETVKFLLSRHPDVNIANWRDETALYYAVASGCLNIVALLVDNGADLEVVNCDGNSVLNIAARDENEEMLQYLISAIEQRGVSNDAEHESVRNFLEKCFQGDVCYITTALQNPMGTVMYQLSTAINYTALSGDNEMLEFLTTNYFHLLASHTEVLMKCMEQNNPGSLSICLESANMNKLNFTDLLCKACKHGHIATVEMLIDVVGRLKGQLLKKSLLESLAFGQYEVARILTQNLAEVDNYSDLQVDKQQFGLNSEFLMILNDREAEYVLL